MVKFEFPKHFHAKHNKVKLSTKTICLMMWHIIPCHINLGLHISMS